MKLLSIICCPVGSSIRTISLAQCEADGYIDKRIVATAIVRSGTRSAALRAVISENAGPSHRLKKVHDARPRNASRLDRRREMVRSYRKYEASHTFGTVCTASSNTLWTPSSLTSRSTTGSGRAYVGANEDVLCWDIKTGAQLSRWHDADNRSAVTCLTQCAAQPDLFAAEHADGAIRIWDALSGQIVVSFNGHKSAVTLLRFDGEGARLASGSRDTDVIVWNLLSETAEFRLRGHKDQITGLEFLKTRVRRGASPHTDEAIDVAEDEETEEKYLLSTSKDALVKVWDLTSPHCVETHVAQTSGECWALGLSPDGEGCITAGNDGELKVWHIDLGALALLGRSDETESKKQDVLTSRGILHRQGKDRTIGVSFHPRQDYIAVHGSDKSVEIWRIRTADEVHRHLQRKRRRRREKAAAAGEALPTDTEDTPFAPDITDAFVSHLIVRTGGKVRSTAWATPSTSSTKKSLQLLVATTNNQLELYTLTTHQHAAKSSSSKETSPADYTRALSVELPGHRTDIRTLCLSSDDRMLASASAGHLKLWNLRTQSCLRTLECGQALCSAFLPGDRIVLLGTKTGELELYDIASSSLIDTIPAHEGAVWTLAVHPDGRSVVTGGADKAAKFWRFDVVEEEIPGTRRTTSKLKLTQTRELKVADDILSVTFSPDSRLLALSTLDNTVKIFFVDSLKLFLTLYGHKLPVLNLSISSDSKLIATCSADKNVRIWGLDFGDCHKAFFAHQDSVMQVAFIPHPMERDEAHAIFSASKDGVLKVWDGDKFEQVQRLQGHHGEIWAMAVSRTGETVVTASHDKSIRLWTVGDDLIFLEEERERELERMYEDTLAANLDKDAREADGEDGEEVAKAGKQTIETLTHGEKLVEALEKGLEDLSLTRDFEEQKLRNPKAAAPQRDPLFLALGGVSAEQHVLSTLRRIPGPALNDALLVLPFAMLPPLFTFLALLLEKRMQPELAWRVAYVMLQAHMNQIVASTKTGEMKGLLESVLAGCEGWQREVRGVVGFNAAGLGILGREAREREAGEWIGDEEEAEEAEKVREEKGRRKRGFASLA